MFGESADPFNLQSLIQDGLGGMDSLAEYLPYSQRINQLAHRTRNEVNRFAPILAADFAETDQEFQCHVDLPGVRQKDLEVTVRDGQLCITAERRHQFDKETSTIRRSERTYGSVSRSIVIPSNVKVDDISVNFDHGVLEIVMPKLVIGQSAVRTIAIGTGKPSTPSGSNNTKGRKG